MPVLVITPVPQTPQVTVTTMNSLRNGFGKSSEFNPVHMAWFLRAIVDYVSGGRLPKISTPSARLFRHGLDSEASETDQCSITSTAFLEMPPRRACDTCYKKKVR